MSKKTNRYTRIFQYSIGIMIFILIFRTINFQKLKITLFNIDLMYFITSLILLPIIMATRSIRFYYIINFKGYKINFIQSYMINYISIALNMVMPASFGDIAMAYFGYKYFGHKEEMLAASVIDKLCALCSLFVLACFSSFITGYFLFFKFFLILSILLIVIFLFPHIIPFHLLEKIFLKFNWAIASKKIYHSLKISFIKKACLLFFSCFLWILTFSLFYLISLCFIKIDYVAALFICPLITMVRFIPITPNGFGTQEASAIYLFQSINVPNDQALAIMLFYRLIIQICPAIIGSIILTLKKFKH